MKTVRHLFRRFIALVLVAAAILLACPLPGAYATGPRTLLIGAAISLTGSTGQEGNLALRGYELWVREVNLHGGIKVGNRRYVVRLKYYNDRSDPAKSAELTRTLLTVDRVHFLLGPYGSGPTLQDSAVSEQAHVPMVEGTGAASAIFSRGFRYIFGVLSPASAYARIMLEAARSVPTPPQTVAITYADDTFSKEVAAAADKYALAQGMRVVAYQQYPSNATDLTNVLKPLKAAPPDMLLNSGHANEAITTMKECKQLGLNPKLYGFTVGPATPEFTAALGSDANDVISSAQWTTQEKYKGIDLFHTPANYARLYLKMFGHPTTYQAASATAAGLALQFAIQRARSIDPGKVRDSLARLQVHTFYGLIRFDANGSNVYKPMATIQIQHGRVVTVFPPSTANAPLVYPTPPFGSR